MEGLPNLDEIRQLLDVVSARGESATTVERYDSDHGVLLSVQSELGDLVERELPSGYASKNEIRALLDRVENTIADHRSKRAAAAAL